MVDEIKSRQVHAQSGLGFQPVNEKSQAGSLGRVLVTIATNPNPGNCFSCQPPLLSQNKRQFEMNRFGMHLVPRILMSAAVVVAFGITIPEKGFAETWTDASGSFSVEAKFVAVSGKDVVLQKADGKTINVPISRLSEASRAQAKRLYELSKGVPVAGAPATADVSSYKPKSRQLNFTPPKPPVIPPLTPYPENASLQQAWEHVRDQALAGRLEVFWQALPDDIQAFADGQEIRERLRPYADDKFAISPEMIDIINKLTELLITKKTFILNSPILAQVPPQFQPLINQGYDPAVGLIYEYAEMTFNTEAVLEHKLGDYLNYHLPRMGAHLQLLVKAVPADQLDAFTGQVTVDQTSETNGTMTFPKDDGGTETVEMVRYRNRWLPKDMVESWLEEKDSIIDKMVENAAGGMAVGNSPETDAMIKEVITQADKAMTPLLAANSQQEFDFALGQALFPLMMMMGGPGGAGGGGPALPPGLPPLPQ
jgi:hypothetical protein